MRFVPQVGGYLTVSLPGEALRAQVDKVDRSGNVVIVTIGQPMTKGHSFRLGDMVACRRTPVVLGGEIWQALENRLDSVPDLTRIAPEPAKPAERPARKRINPVVPPKKGTAAKK